MEQISTRYFKIFYTKLPHYVESENNLKYSTPDAACFDICASVAAPHTILPQQRFMCPTGLKLAPENPFWLRVNGRSGLAAKHGIIPIGGIIDTDYRGEPMIILLNTGTEPYTIRGGDKIAQIECPFPYKAVFEEISPEKFAELAQTTRGDGGFGSTGRR
ncbi:MAG: dUTP diphosphatase [Alphaproteobacteria bacterium]|nr:dUTP diphosphatase [Alphaproteobacteria bacterium]MBS6996066.1 dUTP diphosphatase [Azospirillum sp.]